MTYPCPIRLNHGGIGNGRKFAFQADCTKVDARMEYVLNTNVLRIALTCADGRFDICDYAPRIPNLDGFCGTKPVRIGNAAYFQRQHDRLMTRANCVGLFSEDIEPETGMLFGNFPQAFTHVGLINTAVTISELLEARDARFRAWS